MTLTTPGLLFPAISLLLLAYTNRSLSLSKVIRDLALLVNEEGFELIRSQIDQLRLRLALIRGMQLLAVLSFAVCTASMFFLFVNWVQVGQILFGIALLALLGSLLISAWEVYLSTGAINMEIERLNKKLV
jgi:hypothetical protein